MLGSIVKGIGSGIGSAVKGIGGAVAETAGLSDFTSALGGEKKLTDKPKIAKVKAFDEDESPTKVLQRILDEVQSIHKVMASQVVPESEKKEEEMDKDKKDDEVLDALGDLGPKDDKKKKKKGSWWKMAAMAVWTWIQSFISWITKPLSWIKSLLKWPFFMMLGKFVITLGRFLLFNPVGIALLTIGIIAINWRAIKKAIKGYWATFKGWVKNTLNWLGLGGLMKEDEEVLGDTATDDESSADDVVPPEATDKEVLQALEDLPDDTITTDDAMDDPDDVSISTSHTGTVSGLGVGSTDAATGATIVGPDYPVTVTPKDAGTDIGPIVSQSAVEADDKREKILFGGDAPLSEEAFQQYADFPGESSEYQEYRSEWNMGYKARGYENQGPQTLTGVIPPRDDSQSDEYVRQYGTKFEPNPDLDFGGMGTSKYKKLTTNEERLKWLDKRIKLASSSEYHSINVLGGEGSLTRQTIGGLQSEKERVLQYAGQFQTGGMIPKGKVGLAGEAGQESVGGQMLEGPSLVSGGEKGTRVKREKQYPAGDSSRRPLEKRMSMREYWKRQASHSIGGGVYSGEFSQPVGKKGSYDREYLRAGMTEADQVAEGKADNARRLQQEKDMTFQSGKAGGLDAIARHRRAGLDTANWFGMGQIGKALVDPRNVTKHAQALFSVDPTRGFKGGKADSGLAKVGWDAELIQNMIKGRGKGRGGEEFSPKQIKFYMAVADFGIDFAQLRDINNTRIRELGTLQDAAGIDSRGANQNWAITILNAMRQNLESQDLTESIEGGMRMVAAQMQNMPSINESTLQQAGQQSVVTVTNRTDTTNSSTASSSSMTDRVGQTQQSIPISNRHGAAPRVV